MSQIKRLKEANLLKSVKEVQEGDKKSSLRDPTKPKSKQEQPMLLAPNKKASRRGSRRSLKPIGNVGSSSRKSITSMMVNHPLSKKGSGKMTFGQRAAFIKRRSYKRVSTVQNLRRNSNIGLEPIRSPTLILGEKSNPLVPGFASHKNSDSNPAKAFGFRRKDTLNEKLDYFNLLPEKKEKTIPKAERRIRQSIFEQLNVDGSNQKAKMDLLDQVYQKL